MSSSNVSVLLRWSVSPLSSLAPRFSLLQKLILGLSDDWQFHENVSWFGQRIKVSDLKPYVTYKVGWLLLFSVNDGTWNFAVYWLSYNFDKINVTSHRNSFELKFKIILHWYMEIKNNCSLLYFSEINHMFFLLI